MPPILPLSLSDGDDGKRKPAASRRRSPREVLPSDGSAVWAVCEAAGYEWGAGYEDALHQLCATKVPGFLTGAWRQTRRSPQEVISLHQVMQIAPFNHTYKSIISTDGNWVIFFCSLLKGRDGDGFPQNQEKFIRDCIRKFPYCEATLLHQLVQNITPVEIVSKTLWLISNILILLLFIIQTIIMFIPQCCWILESDLSEVGD